MKALDPSRIVNQASGNDFLQLHLHRVVAIACALRDRDTFRDRVPFDTGVHYPRTLTQQPAYQEFVRSPCPEAERWAAECVSFPCFPEMTDDEIEAVCRAIR